MCVWSPVGGRAGGRKVGCMFAKVCVGGRQDVRLKRREGTDGRRMRKFGSQLPGVRRVRASTRRQRLIEGECESSWACPSPETTTTSVGKRSVCVCKETDGKRGIETRTCVTANQEDRSNRRQAKLDPTNPVEKGKQRRNRKSTREAKRTTGERGEEGRKTRPRPPPGRRASCDMKRDPQQDSFQEVF